MLRESCSGNLRPVVPTFNQCSPTLIYWGNAPILQMRKLPVPWGLKPPLFPEDTLLFQFRAHSIFLSHHFCNHRALPLPGGLPLGPGGQAHPTGPEASLRRLYSLLRSSLSSLWCQKARTGTESQVTLSCRAACRSPLFIFLPGHTGDAVFGKLQ